VNGEKPKPFRLAYRPRGVATREAPAAGRDDPSRRRAREIIAALIVLFVPVILALSLVLFLVLRSLL
jgi:hypothetical protein